MPSSELSFDRLLELVRAGERAVAAHDTLAARARLAATYATVGRLHEAAELYQGVVAEQERDLGPDHPDTLGRRHDLAGCAAVGRCRRGACPCAGATCSGPRHADPRTGRRPGCR